MSIYLVYVYIIYIYVLYVHGKVVNTTLSLFFPSSLCQRVFPMSTHTTIILSHLPKAMDLLLLCLQAIHYHHHHHMHLILDR